MSKTGWSQIAKDFAKPAMTDEEAAKTQSIIDHISSLAPGCYPAISDKDDAKIIVSALREKIERDNPKPLSLDELREMDGEPVWAIPLGESISRWRKCWRIYRNRGVGITADDDSKTMWFVYPKNYGTDWLAYRSKPKEVQS